jgi:dehydratase
MRWCNTLPERAKPGEGIPVAHLRALPTAVTALATAGLLLAPASMALAGTDRTRPAPVTTTTTVPYECRTVVGGEWVPIVGHTRDYTVSAPAEVRRGVPFTVVVDPAPASTNAAYIQQIKDVRVAVKLPADATLLGWRLTGGSGVGAGPTVSVSGDQLTVTAPGPLAGGTVYDMPAITLYLVSLRAPATVTTAPGGTSFAQPGFAFTRQVVGEDGWGPLECFPDPAQPVRFSTTAVLPWVR